MEYKLNRKGSEKILRDLRLKEIHLGNTQGVLSKNVFKDKPWTTRYADKPADIIDLWETPYNNFKKIAIQDLDKVVIYDPIKKIGYTNRELLELIDKTMSGLKEMGINENSRVGVILNSCVEEAVMFMALNGLGATGKYIDFMKSIPAIAHSVSETHLDMLIMEEMFLPLEPAINEENLPIIVANTDKSFRDEKHTSFNDLCQKGTSKVEPAKYSDGKITAVINSSGTTGDPKPIDHSDYSLNSAALKMLFTDYPLNKDNVILKMMPIQLGIGLVTSLYTGLVSGATTIIIGGTEAPDLAAKMVYSINNFEKIKEENNLNPNAKLTLITAPIFFRMLASCPEVNDLSCMGAIMTAGSKMTKNELDKMKPLLEAKKCNVPVCNAYGQNEQLGAVSANTTAYNKNGSAGFPVIGTDICIVNPETFDVLGINEVGLILENSDSEFLGYEGMDEETKKAYITLNDGSKWFNSNDLGYMDEDYYLHITGRTTRVAVRNDFKFSLDEIERKIKTIPEVIDCAAIVSSEASSWEDITVFITTYDAIETIENTIKSSGILAEFEVPTNYIQMNDIPYLQSGKINYQKLTREYKENNQQVRGR